LEPEEVLERRDRNGAGLDGAIHRAVVSFCGEIAAGVRIFNMFMLLTLDAVALANAQSNIALRSRVSRGGFARLKESDLH